ncbi:hypothetical protein FRC17_009558, partial [Serendipita sp. 399]
MVTGPYQYENPYASVPTTDASNNTPYTYPPVTASARGSVAQLNDTTTITTTPGSISSQQPLVYSPPSSSYGHHHQQRPSIHSHHQAAGSISSTLRNDSPKAWPGKLPDDLTTTTNNNPSYAIDPDVHRANSRNDPNRWSYDSIIRPDNMRTFSPTWFKYQWRLQSQRKRLGRLLYVISGFVLLLGWLTITIIFGRNLETNEATNSSVYANTQLSGPGASIHGEHLFLLGQLNSFDPLTRSLNIDWTAFYATVPLNPSNLLATQVDIDRREDTAPLAMFRDVLAVPDMGTNITDYQPFRVQNPRVKPTGFLGLTQFDQINTNIGLGQRSSNIWLQPEFGYPFDVFRGMITWVAANNETISVTGRPGTDVRPISGAVLTDSLLNMKVRTNVTATCLVEDVPGCELIVQVWVTRTGLVKFAVFVVFGINYSRIRVKITDVFESRYEVPESVFPRPKPATSSFTPAIKFRFTTSPFSFSILRVATDEILFDTENYPLIFAPQYIRLKTTLPADANIYGLGEHTIPFRLPIDHTTRTLWNRDSFEVGTNIYGSHPIYFEHRTTGTHGVFMLNSNGMDIKLRKEGDHASLEYNIIGGIVDLYFFAGPTPVDVAQQYALVTGTPAEVPYWSLGLHQCRWGYKDIGEVGEVITNYSAAGIPLETMWIDIDYMDDRLIFTTDPTRYPKNRIQEVVKGLHEKNQHFILMVDPAVGTRPGQAGAFDRGTQMDIWVKGPDGKPHIG